MSTAITPATTSPAIRYSPYAYGARSLVSSADLDAAEIASVIDHAISLKTYGADSRFPPLAGKHVALIFDKPSLRTRVSFEVGIARLGGTTTCMAGHEVGLGSRESVADVAHTLAQYVDAIVIRTLNHGVVEELAATAGIPVINALTELEHPCQALADLQTIKEHFGAFGGKKLAFVGDGNNVSHSLLLAGAAVGLDVTVANPAGFEPDKAIVDQALELARGSSSRIELSADPCAAVAGADAVYTDVWASMGEEDEAAERRRIFASFSVTSNLMSYAAPNAIVMHCLPAHRGEEIAADVIDGPHSVVFQQAQNRMFAQQAVLLHLLRQSGGPVNGMANKSMSGAAGGVGALSAP